MASPPIGVLLPNGQQQFCDANGQPLAGGFVYTYAPGTTTPQLTYVDQALTTPNTNPVVLDSAGRAVIWGTGIYRQIVTDLLGTLVWDQETSDDGAAVLLADVDNLTAITNNLQSEINTIQTSIAAVGINMDVITDTGDTTYTLKATKVLVLSQGAGGGGAGTNGGATPNPAPGGGGGSGWTILTGLVVGKTLKITIGAGGTGGSTNNTGGQDGGDTVVQSASQTISTVTTSGGKGGVSPTGAAGHGGAVTGATISLHGEDGGTVIGGRSAMFFPFGTGGSSFLNGQIILGNGVVGQNGTQGIVALVGIW